MRGIWARAIAGVTTATSRTASTDKRRTRAERAAQAKIVVDARFNSKQRVFIDFVLSHYISEGVRELSWNARLSG